MNGLKSLLQSRKFWTALAALAGVVLSEAVGWDEASAGDLADALVVLATVLIGAIALEDAAGKIGKVGW